jgi:hypothetical protein
VTSEINFISINENFPVPGQDNDTQVFRDNFDTIKRSLRTAKDEITDLQDNTARTDESNDFNKNVLRNLVLEKSSVQLQNYGNPISNNIQEINFTLGMHHVLRVAANINLEFVGFPGDPNISVADLLSGVGKITLELYGDGTVRTITFNQPNGTVVKTSNFPSSILTVQSSTDPILMEVYRYNANIIFIRYLGQFV